MVISWALKSSVSYRLKANLWGFAPVVADIQEEPAAKQHHVHKLTLD